MSITHPNTCPNCGHNAGQGRFCPHCGQKREISPLSVRALLGEFFSVVFNVDNIFFRTLRTAIFPGRLAKEYIAGKRKSYLAPPRFFFITWLLMATASLPYFSMDSRERDNNRSLVEIITKSLPEDTNRTDTTAKGAKSNANLALDINFFGFARHHIHLVPDSLARYPATGDTLYISYNDLQLSPDSIIRKYQIHSRRDRFAIRRMQRLNTTYRDLPGFLGHNIIWLVVANVPIAALILWLLYHKKHAYYIIHVIYVLYMYGVFFAILALFFLSDLLPGIAGTLLPPILLLGIPLYSFFSMRNFYTDAHHKTIRWVIYLVLDFLCFVTLLALYLTLSLLLF